MTKPTDLTSRAGVNFRQALKATASRSALDRRTFLAAGTAAAAFAVTSTRARAAALKPEKDELKLGFIKLTDMAPLAVAKENGYFEDEGLIVTLEAQANWKVLLDRVITGELDGAHMLAGQPLAEDPDRGLDHGAYVPLVEMYPDADVPVLQVSMPTLDPEGLYEIGRKLAPLRDEGVLIVGSGFFTHNLRALSPDGRVQPVMAEFDRWGQETLARGDLDALLDFQHKAPAARAAHPRTEHFAPLFVTLGAAGGDLAGARTVIDGFWLGLAKRSIQVN